MIYPFVQKIINIIINIARISNNKKNPVLDFIFSLEENTSHEVIPKFEPPILSLFISKMTNKINTLNKIYRAKLAEEKIVVDTRGI